MTDLDASGNASPHIPVLLHEVLAALAPLDGARIIDGTFGAGGYSRALLEAGAQVFGIDRDPSVQPFADRLLADFPERFQFARVEFSLLDSVVGGAADGIVYDLGISSMQIDEPQRGFSFMRDGPLDMRMDPDLISAAEVVNSFEEERIANILFAYGEERKSRRIAKAIVMARDVAPIETTAQLARIIEKAIGRKPGDAHPATRSFQALRIAINAELDHLVEGLFAAERKLPEGGRLAVVSFHSIEDRIVKRFLGSGRGAPAPSRHLPAAQGEVEEPRWTRVSKSTKASPAEVKANSRSRSATLRSAVRTAAQSRRTTVDDLGVPSPARLA